MAAGDLAQNFLFRAWAAGREIDWWGVVGTYFASK
jgi:hypothetical protein